MIYTRARLEAIANQINEKYFPDRLLSVLPFDAYDLLEALGCDVEWKYISPDDSISGATFFEDGYWYIWSSGTYQEGDSCNKEFFPKGTVLINQIIIDKNDRKKENFVVAHECAHQIKDEEYFKNHGADICHLCRTNDIGSTRWYTNMSELEIIERQTNYLAAAIWMPEDVTRERFFKIARYKNIPDHPLEIKKYVNGWIAQLAKEYNINFNPMKYRLQDLNILER